MIEVQGLGKQYRRIQGSYKTLREDSYNLVGRLLGRPSSIGTDVRHVWVLRHLNFTVPPGETLGVIGVNGSGKTTLLRLLARVTKPTEGTIKVNGRIGTLIELTSGFEPELTGKENVYLNGSLLGMSNKEVREKFDEIVAYSEIGEWVDVPFKRYSSGMMVRLGFAVAIQIQPEALLVDEVLSVGDTAFQAKCHKTIQGLLNAGCATIMVSHSMVTIKNNCQRVIWIDKGEIIMSGLPEEVCEAYINRG